MSFLNELCSQKTKLKKTQTLITTSDGQQYYESNNEKILIESNSNGFVVDTKPDDIPSLIIENLYIGSQDCTDKLILDRYNIKKVLSVGIAISEDICHKFVSCLDLPETDIKKILGECLPFIDKALTEKTNILIHCNAGVSRTAMVVIGYLMLYKNYTYEQAYSLIKSKRPVIQPNSGFKAQLKHLAQLD